MKNEKPIIFCEDMIKSIKNTKPGVWPAEPIDPEKPFKGMTRRVIKPQPYIIQKADPGYIDVWGWDFAKNEGMHWTEVSLPRRQEEICEHSRYKFGDHLWVRETWYKDNASGKYGYKADANEYGELTIYTGDTTFVTFAPNKWRPSMYMPHTASRLLLEVKSVKIEQLQGISEEEARAEGVGGIEPGEVFINFGNLWDSINAKRGYSWEVNPWVYVIEFMRVK